MSRHLSSNNLHKTYKSLNNVLLLLFKLGIKSADVGEISYEVYHNYMIRTLSINTLTITTITGEI